MSVNVPRKHSYNWFQKYIKPRLYQMSIQNIVMMWMWEQHYNQDNYYFKQIPNWTIKSCCYQLTTQEHQSKPIHCGRGLFYLVSFCLQSSGRFFHIWSVCALLNERFNYVCIWKSKIDVLVTYQNIRGSLLYCRSLTDRSCKISVEIAKHLKIAFILIRNVYRFIKPVEVKFSVKPRPSYYKSINQ